MLQARVQLSTNLKTKKTQRNGPCIKQNRHEREAQYRGKVEERRYSPAALGFFRLWPFCDRPHIIGYRHRRGVAMFSFCNDKPIVDQRTALIEPRVAWRRANSERRAARSGEKTRGEHDSPGPVLVKRAYTAADLAE